MLTTKNSLFIQNSSVTGGLNFYSLRLGVPRNTPLAPSSLRGYRCVLLTEGETRALSRRAICPTSRSP